MFEFVLQVGIVWSVLLAAVLGAAATFGHSILMRILWLDTLALALISGFALLSFLRSSTHYLDAALALALLAFAGTIAAVTYEREARLL